MCVCVCVCYYSPACAQSSLADIYSPVAELRLTSSVTRQRSAVEVSGGRSCSSQGFSDCVCSSDKV